MENYRKILEKFSHDGKILLENSSVSEEKSFKEMSLEFSKAPAIFLRKSGKRIFRYFHQYLKSFQNFRYTSKDYQPSHKLTSTKNPLHQKKGRKFHENSKKKGNKFSVKILLKIQI